MTQIFEGTNQIQRLVIGRQLLRPGPVPRDGRAHEARADDVVLVTGGASGLGAATVRAVVAAGASAVIMDLPARPARRWPPSWAIGCGSPRPTYATRIRSQAGIAGGRVILACCGSRSTVRAWPRPAG